MASYEGITPRQQDEYYQKTQRTDNTTRQENYNEFMTHRGHEAQNNQKSLTLEYGKTIKLLRNGDEFYRGQKVVINSRKYRYFDVFLDDLSDMMQARFGAVRNIHTPVHGHKVRSLEQIEDGKTYVAAGAGRFVKLNYGDISEGKRPRILPKRLPALQRQNIQVPQYDKPGNVLIFVFKNGEVLTPPAKILLTKNTLSSYDAVLDEITYKVQLLNGAVLKLYTLDGELVITPAQLISGQGYVAANKERFKRCQYMSPLEMNSSPSNTRKINSQPIYNSSNPSASGKSTFSYPGKPYTGWHKDMGKREGSLPPVIGPKPNRNNQAKQNNSRLDVDRDEGGIFKAKNKNSNNVKTVQDSNELYVDMPVDFKKAKQIINEEIVDERNKNSLPQNTTTKPNSKQPPQQNISAPINDAKQTYEPKKIDYDAYLNSQNDQTPIETKRSVENATKQSEDMSKKSLNIGLANDKEKEIKKPIESLNDDGSKTQRISTNNDNDKNQKMNDQEAATKIQSAYRGFKAREDLKKV